MDLYTQETYVDLTSDLQFMTNVDDRRAGVVRGRPMMASDIDNRSAVKLPVRVLYIVYRMRRLVASKAFGFACHCRCCQDVPAQGESADLHTHAYVRSPPRLTLACDVLEPKISSCRTSMRRHWQV